MKFTPTQQTLLLEAAAFYLEQNPAGMDTAILNRAMDKLLHSGHRSENPVLSPALGRWLEERGL